MAKLRSRRLVPSLEALEDRLAPAAPVAATVPSFNEIIITDTKGKEQIFIHGQRDQAIGIEHDEAHWVGHDRTKTVDNNETITVHGSRTETVDKNETITIRTNRTESVDQDETITIHGSRTETVDKSETITIRINRTEGVGQDETIIIHGSRTETVDKNETITIHTDRTESVGQNETITITGGRTLTVLDIDISIKLGADSRKDVVQSILSGPDNHQDLVQGLYLEFLRRPLSTAEVGDPLLAPNSEGTITLTGNDIIIGGDGQGVSPTGDTGKNVRIIMGPDGSYTFELYDEPSAPTGEPNQPLDPPGLSLHLLEPSTTVEVTKNPDGSTTTITRVSDLQGNLVDETKEVKYQDGSSTTTTTHNWYVSGILGGTQTTTTQVQKMPDGSETITEYDGEGKKTSTKNVKTENDGSVTTTDYDDNDRVTKKTNVKTNADGSKTTTKAEYDKQGNVTKTSQEDSPAPATPPPVIPLFPFGLSFLDDTNPDGSTATTTPQISLTARSHVFAVWVSVGFFTALDDSVVPSTTTTTTTTTRAE